MLIVAAIVCTLGLGCVNWSSSSDLRLQPWTLRDR